MSAREMLALGDAIYDEVKDMPGMASSTHGQVLYRLARAHRDAAARLAVEGSRQIDALRALSTIKAMIGNVDHSQGNGPNAAAMRGEILNDIRDLCERALKL